MQNRRFGKSCLGGVLLMVVLMTPLDGQQRKGFPEPPAPAVRDETPPQPKTYRRTDTVEMEREARELSALAASIPNDVDLVKKGLLPREVMDKLKRIEKLSKQLRGQIHP